MVNVDGDGVLNDWDSTRTTDSEEMSPVVCAAMPSWR